MTPFELVEEIQNLTVKQLKELLINCKDFIKIESSHYKKEDDVEKYIPFLITIDVNKLENPGFKPFWEFIKKNEFNKQVFDQQKLNEKLDELKRNADKEFDNAMLWGKAKPKDYEILSYYGSAYGFDDGTLIKLPNGKFILDFRFGDNREWLESQLPLDKLQIKSVRRLSDGEVFTVNDDFTFNGLFGKNWSRKSTKLLGFDFNINKELCIKYQNGIVLLEKALKPQKPIFTTSDGVDIFEGDSVALLGLNNWAISYPIKAAASPFYGKTGNEFKYFSTKEAAKEYINKNKPSPNNHKPIYQQEISLFIYQNNQVGLITKINGDSYGSLAAFPTKESADEFIISNTQQLSIKDLFPFDELQQVTFTKQELIDLIKHKNKEQWLKQELV